MLVFTQPAVHLLLCIDRSFLTAPAGVQIYSILVLHNLSGWLLQTPCSHPTARTEKESLAEKSSNCKQASLWDEFSCVFFIERLEPQSLQHIS